MTISRIKKRQQERSAFYIKIAMKMAILVVFLSTLFLLAEQLRVYFPIRTVRVTGVLHLQQIEVQQALTPLVDRGFFDINVDVIKDRLLQSPWVAKAAVQRVWPDKVLVTITEKMPVAHWNKTSLLSSKGEIFTPEAPLMNEELPYFSGPDGQQIEILDSYRKMENVLTALHLKITYLELTPSYYWNIVLENGIKLSVNNKDVLTRLSHFVKVYPKIIGSRGTYVEYIDLRYPNGLAVKWKTIT